MMGNDAPLPPSTYAERAAYIARCEQQMAEDQKRVAEATERHKKQSAVVQKAMDEFIEAFNAPCRELAADIRKSMLRSGVALNELSAITHILEERI